MTNETYVSTEQFIESSSWKLCGEIDKKKTTPIFTNAYYYAAHIHLCAFNNNIIKNADLFVKSNYASNSWAFTRLEILLLINVPYCKTEVY